MNAQIVLTIVVLMSFAALVAFLFLYHDQVTTLARAPKPADALKEEDEEVIASERRHKR